MNTKKFVFVFGLLFAFSIGFAFADSSAQSAATTSDAVPATDTTEPVAVEGSDVTSPDLVVTEPAEPAAAAPVQVIVVDQSAVEKRANAHTNVGGRPDARASASVTAAFRGVAAGVASTPIAAAATVPTATTVLTSDSTPAAVAMIKTTAAVIRAPAAAAAKTTPAAIKTATTTTTTASNLECNPGEYPSGSACVKCSQKNNPGADWANPGKDCKITACISDEYFLYDADGAQPQCLKKCDIWGGKASKAWKVDDWDICGSGAGIDCDDGFVKTREQTSSSDVQFWHCIPKGTMSGSCSKPGKVNICDFPNGRAKQYCENGFWGTCTVTKLCNTGYVESAPRQVTAVSHGADTKTGVFDCVAK
ncbi:MAG: hypothetical protein FWC51_04515 [Proteobacteria bacterium]|nr:hypothetical protein [Pseudomonadota bacterium]